MRSTARPCTTDPPIVADLARRLEALEREVSLLRQSRDSRDRWTSELRRVLAERTAGLPFTAAQLLRHAAVDAVLTRALDDGMLRTPQEVGSWLRDHVGTYGGVTIARLPRRQWRVCRSSTPVLDS